MTGGDVRKRKKALSRKIRNSYMPGVSERGRVRLHEPIGRASSGTVAQPT